MERFFIPTMLTAFAVLFIMGLAVFVNNDDGMGWIGKAIETLFWVSLFMASFSSTAIVLIRVGVYFGL